MKDPTQNAIEIATRYADMVVGPPLKEIGGLIADQIGYWRFKNKVRTVLRAKKFLEEQGIEPERALPETVLPLLDAAGDTADDVLSDMFAGLLASHLSPTSRDLVHPSYAKVVGQLAPLDAVLLRSMYDDLRASGAEYRRVGYTLEAAIEALDVDAEVVTLSFQNLRRLGICDHGSGVDALNQKEQVVFTSYGWTLMVQVGQPESST